METIITNSFVILLSLFLFNKLKTSKGKNKNNLSRTIQLPNNSIVYPFLKNTFGWGDQLVGFSTSILISKKFNKDIYILFTDEEYMNSIKSIFNLNDFKILFIPHNVYEKNKINYQKNFIDHFIKNTTHVEKINNFFKNEMLQSKPIILYVNQPIASLLYDDNKLYAKDLKNAYKDINTIYFPFHESLKNEWNLLKDTVTIGIQIRTGDKSIKTSPHKIHLLLDESEYKNFTINISKNILKIDQSIKNVYIATDDVEFLKTFKNNTNLKGEILSLGLLENTHSMNATGDNFKKIFQEYYYLTQCSILVTSKNSNFGITAAYYSNNKNVIFYEENGTILKLYDLEKNAINKEFTYMHDLNDCVYFEDNDSF
jgi:hypothetical protein